MDWFNQNMELINEADRHIGVTLADRKFFCEHTSPEIHQICDEIFNNVLKIGPHGAENNSVLLLGESGSGKTHVVEWCIRELLEAQPNTVVLRARGSAYATDVECLRHLATQMTDKLDSIPHANASFKAGMDWIKSIFKGSFQKARAMVMVLDQFEYFCSRARQTLLYNLFDIAQEAGVHLSVIGTSDHYAVMDSLEKRIKSRFSMRHIHTFLPTTMDSLVQVLVARLQIPHDSGMPAAFVNQFGKYVEAALFAKRTEWRPLVELGYDPSWFLAKCVPVAELLRDAALSEPKPKRARLAYMPSFTQNEASLFLLDSLSHYDQIMLIAHHRQSSRGLVSSLSTLLHEIRLLHESRIMSGVDYIYSTPAYTAAFEKLLSMKILEVAKSNTGEASKEFLPVVSSMSSVFKELVKELGNEQPAPWKNPLRALPSQIQQWSSPQRA